jgi:hypothetical protein
LTCWSPLLKLIMNCEIAQLGLSETLKLTNSSSEYS